MTSKVRPRRVTGTLVTFAVAVATVVSAPPSFAASSARQVKPAAQAKATPPTNRVCPEPARAGEKECLSFVRTDVATRKGIVPNAQPNGFGPADLHSAYALPTGVGSQTVAIVDAFDNPNAESDLATYRRQFGLPACTMANGCFKKIDQRGGTNYPPPNSGWAGEIALDVDMVSAICPGCHILLVESDDNFMQNLGAAVNQAATQGAKYISNSYGGGEGSDQLQADESYFKHPGVAITASSGDNGYGVEYPAASQYVTAVGGTSLTKDTSARGWSEKAWSGAGSGCSKFDPKPSFQKDTGCAHRTVADVSAVADPGTGVAVYNGGWHVYGGTSVSSPIIASVYALAGQPSAGTMPNSFPYADAADLNDVTTGSNGTCTPAYLCTAGPGYDGPTGLGTPKGIAAFRSGPHGLVTGTVTDTANGHPLAGVQVKAGDITDTTDGQGHYGLSVKPGTYDVTATKYGYVDKTSPGVVVTDGATITDNFPLAPKPRANVTGTVRDASGHGWPIAATVQVKEQPTSAVRTDPATGRYTLAVPAGDTYTVQVNPAYPGYLPDSQQVTVGSSDVGHDVGIKVDPATCSAAGYTYHYAGDTQTFDGTTAPAGWTIDDKIGKGQTWVFDDPGKRGNQTGGSGGFGIIDSSHYGINNQQDTSLISPVLDFSKRSHPAVTFHSDFFASAGSNEIGDVDVTTDGGKTWANVWHQIHTRRGPRTESVDLPAAAGSKTVQVRFHFTARWGLWWQVDDVFLGDRTCDPVPGGLVVGQVTDKNTGKGLSGALVKSDDRPAENATTVPDGSYWFFSSLTGSHSFTAGAPFYADTSQSVNVAANWATPAKFNMPAPRVVSTPATISKTVNWQGKTSAKVTLKNTGSAPINIAIGQQPGNFQPKTAGAPLQLVKGKFSPLRMRPGKTGPTSAPARPAPTPYAQPWTSIADYPVSIMDNGVATLNGKVYSVGGVGGPSFHADLYVYDPLAEAWTSLAPMKDAREEPQAAFVDGKLYVTGGWGENGFTDPKLEIYDPASNTWTTGAANPKPYAAGGTVVVGKKIYVVGGCTGPCGASDVQVYDTATNTWSSVAAYPERTSWISCAQLYGKVYCAGGIGGADSNTASKHTNVYDPASNTWTPLADMPADQWAAGYVGAEGQLVISGGVTNNNSAITNQGFAYSPGSNTWTALPNSNNTTFRSGSACGFYKIGGAVTFGPSQFDASKGAEMLPGYGECGASPQVPWVSTDKTSVTLKPGKPTTITVTMNANVAAIDQPGTYGAQLTFNGANPYGIQPVGLTMAVKPPATWGKVTGTITGTPCVGSPTPLAGATVQIDTWAASYTLKTDKDGKYQLWLDVRNNPLSLIAARDGWAPQARSVSIVRHGTTMADFALKPNHKCS